jgi:hypothetical protein
MKKKYHTVRTIPKATRNNVERGTIATLTSKYMYMTATFPHLVQALLKSGGVELILWTQNLPS